MNIQAMISKCEWIEVNGKHAADMRHVVEGERFALIAAVRSGDAARIKATMTEAIRVLCMWGID